MSDEGIETRSFREFSEGLIAYDGAAAAELLNRYSRRLVWQAGRQLGGRLAAKVDPEDVFQSVLRTFYRRLGAGEIELRDWESLSGLLSLLTLRKCQRQTARFATASRNVRREVSLSGGTRDSAEILVPDREPTPDEIAAFKELVERLLERASERDGRIIRLLFAGTDVDRIAAEIGCSRRTVYRTLAWVRDELISTEFDDPALKRNTSQ